MNTDALKVGGLALSVGGALATIGVFLEWATLTDLVGRVAPLNENGFDYQPWGTFALIAGVSLAVVGVALLGGIDLPLAVVLGTGGSSFVAVLSAIVNLVEINKDIDSLSSRLSGIAATAEVGPGLWLLLTGGCIAGVGASLVVRSVRTVIPPES